MDVEEDDYSLLSLFDVSPAAFPWPADVIHGIEQRRAAMADVLIFDILLTLGGVKHPDALYPPRDADVLQRLLIAIEDSSYDALKKDGLIYFLLKWHLDGRETYYAQSRCIPPQFVALADAYWCLDSGENVARAVSLLADARLNRDYTSKILQAVSLDSNSHQLILRYVRTAKPLLTEPDDIDAYSIALAESSLLDAWKHQRTYAEGGATRDRLIRNIFTWCLTPKPRSKPLTQLVAFPLSAYEQTQLHAYALHPPRALPTSAASVIQDLAFMRLVQSGQHAAAIKLNHQLMAANARSKDRKQTVEELMAVMPPAERQLLEAEIERMNPTGDAGTRFLTNGVGGAVAGPSTGIGDLSMSWESVRSPKKQPSTLTPQKESPQKPIQQQQPQRQQKGNPVPPSPAPLFESAVPPIPHRSGAPRFGGQSPASASISASGASSSFSAVREMFDAMARQSPRQPAGSLFAVGSPASASASASATLTGQPASGRGAGQSISAGAGPSAGASASSTPRKRGRVSGSASAGGASLFETAGSANQTGNAFFQPAPKSISRSAANTTPGSVLAGTKRPLEAISSPQSAGASARRAKRGDVSASAGAGAGNGSMSMSISAPGTRRGQVVEEEEEDADADVEMHDSEAEVDAEAEAEETAEGDLTFPHIEVVVDAASDHGLSEDDGEEEGHSEIEAEAGAGTEVEELSYSLFAPPADSARDGLERGETRKSTSPPGAFLAPEEENEREQDHEQQHEHERVDVEHERAVKGKGKEKQYDDEYEEEYEHRPQRDAMGIEELTTNKAGAARTPPRRRESRIPRTQTQARQKQELKPEQSTRKQPARLTRTRSAQMEAQLMRSIPGAFLDVEDIPEERGEHSHEEQSHEEESDVVPPRPSTPSTGPSTRTRRARPEREKTRTRAEATAKTPSRPRASRGAEVPRTGTRRSTRLAESESSDEQRPTRSRKSTKSGGSTGTDKGTKTPGRATRASARRR